jgi:hypothetical protein
VDKPHTWRADKSVAMWLGLYVLAHALCKTRFSLPKPDHYLFLKMIVKKQIVLGWLYADA